jgi:hypothetical protein
MSRLAQKPVQRAANKPVNKPATRTEEQKAARKPAFMQAKLAVSQPGDAQEREADQVATEVSRAPRAGLQRASLEPAITPEKQDESLAPKQEVKPVAAATRISRIARMPARKKACRPGCNANPPAKEETLQTRLFRQESGEEEELQTRLARQAEPAQQPAGEAGQSLDETTEARIAARQGQGAALDEAVRQDMETQFGRDLSNVHIHTDAEAAELCAQVGARAFTVGGDIFFAPGEYAPETAAGRELLAHELTHVVQQGGGASRKLMRNATPPPPPPAQPDSGSAGAAYRVSAGEYAGTEIEPAARRITISKLSLPSFKRRNRGMLPSQITLPDPATYERGNTQQVPNWREEVRSEAETQVATLAGQARDRGGVNANGQVFLQARDRDDFLLFGTEAELIPQFEIPIWDSAKTGRSFQVDHIHEMQLGGEDVKTNYELLDASANMSAGWRLGNPENGGEIGNRIRGALRSLKSEHAGVAGIPEPRDWRSVRYGYLTTFSSYDFGLEVNGDPDKFWSMEAIKQGRHARLLRPMRERELERLGREGTLTFFASAQGGERLPMPRRLPMRNWIPRVDLREWNPNDVATGAGTEAGTLVVDALRSSSGRARAAGVSVPPDYPSQIWHVRKIDGIHGGYIDINDEQNARGVRQSLRLPGMSPIELETMQLSARGLFAEGRVLPTVPLIGNANIPIRIQGNEVELYKTFSADELSLPAPFHIDNCELSVFFSSARGLGVEGRADFSVTNLGEGFVSAAASMEAGFALEGEFNFDSDLFDRARINLWYRNQQFGAAGEIGIDQPDKIRGIRAANIQVNYETGQFAASGTVEPNIPGVQEAGLNVAYAEDQGLTIGGNLQLAEMPGIRSGSIEVSVNQCDDVWRVTASGTAQPAVPGIDSELTVNYDDGAFNAEFNGAFARGMLAGTVNVGVTNRSVGEDGQPNGEPVPGAPLIVYGGGSATVQVAPWLRGTAGVRFAPNGEVTVNGEIGLPSQIEFFPRRQIDKDIFSIDIPIPIVPGIFAEVGGGLSARAGIGPGVIDQLQLGIEYNPAHEENTHVTGDGHVNVPADAGLRLAVHGGIGLGIPAASVSGGLEVGGELGIAGAAEAGVHVDWMPSQGLEIDAYARLSAQPKFVFDVSGYVEVEALFFTIYENRWRLASFEYGSDMTFGVNFPIHYREGEPFDISLDDVEFETPEISVSDILGGLVEQVV